MTENYEFLAAVGRPRVQPGGDLREERAALHGPGPTPHRAELPRHRHPPRHEPGGEAVALPAVQGFPEGKDTLYCNKLLVSPIDREVLLFSLTFPLELMGRLNVAGESYKFLPTVPVDWNKFPCDKHFNVLKN